MAKPPVLVPREYRAELAKLSKAALMDMVWNYAMSRASASGTEQHPEARRRAPL